MIIIMVVVMIGKKMVKLRQDGDATHLIRDAALDIIENHSGPNPLFLNINFGGPPYTQRGTPTKYREIYFY